MKDALAIDGSRGEGGGQILRTSLSLAAVTGLAVDVTGIRAGRKKPGLLRQHLTCVRAIAEITGAAVRGDELGSRELHLAPGPVRAGYYRFAVGSAGSAALVFQTVLWPLLLADGRSRVVFEGGTHNPMSPPFHFLERAFVPLLRRFGAAVDLRLDRYGFYPRGGGSFTADIEPCDALAAVDVPDGGVVRDRRAVAVVANLPRHIAERELAVIRERIGTTDSEIVDPGDPRATGNVVMIELEGDHVTEVVTGFGQRGVRAEAVAGGACDEAAAYLAHAAPVGEHLADQLIIPMALAGAGRFRTGPLSLHTRTNIDVVGEFVDTAIAVDERDDRTVVVSAG